MRSKAKNLFEIAEGQQGYFSARQASEAGYGPGSRNHHAKAGNWVRAERGVYRLARFPQSEEEQFVSYALWFRNRAGGPEPAYSHQTALSIHGLSDANPAKLHVTVPMWFRRTRGMPQVLVVHHGSLVETDIEQKQGFMVTRPLRTIADVVQAESLSRDLVAQALVEARGRGLITAREVDEFRREHNPPEWVAELLSRHQK